MGAKTAAAVGTISLTLSGSGTAVVVFGNPHTGGAVNLRLDSTEISSACAQTYYKTASFAFTDGQVMQLSEVKGIMLFHSVSFECDYSCTIGQGQSGGTTTILL